MYYTVAIATGMLFSGAAAAQLSCPPRSCGFNGPSAVGTKAEESMTQTKSAAVKAESERVELTAADGKAVKISPQTDVDASRQAVR